MSASRAQKEKLFPVASLVKMEVEDGKVIVDPFKSVFLNREEGAVFTVNRFVDKVVLRRFDLIDEEDSDEEALEGHEERKKRLPHYYMTVEGGDYYLSFSIPFERSDRDVVVSALKHALMRSDKIFQQNLSRDFNVSAIVHTVERIERRRKKGSGTPSSLIMLVQNWHDEIDDVDVSGSFISIDGAAEIEAFVRALEES